MTINAQYQATDLLLAICPNVISFQSTTHYYTLYIHYDLLGELIISKHWVKKFSKRSGVNHVIVSINILEHTVAKLIKRLLRNGCNIVG